jgi:hypothetical protein
MIRAMRFDVYANPIIRTRAILPYVVQIQSDRATTGLDKVVAFLGRAERFPRTEWHTPIVEVQGESYAVLLASITNVRAVDLRIEVSNIGIHEEKITRGLDWLFYGI